MVQPFGWQLGLFGRLSAEQGVFHLLHTLLTETVKVGRWCTSKMVYVLETLRLAPKGTIKTHDFLCQVGLASVLTVNSSLVYQCESSTFPLTPLVILVDVLATSHVTMSNIK